MTNSRVDTALGAICLMLLGTGLTRADDIVLAVLGIAAFFVGSILAVVRFFPNERKSD